MNHRNPYQWFHTYQEGVVLEIGYEAWECLLSNITPICIPVVNINKL